MPHRRTVTLFIAIISTWSLVACTRDEKPGGGEQRVDKRRTSRGPQGRQPGTVPDRVKKSRDVHIEIFRFLDQIVVKHGSKCDRIAGEMKAFIVHNGRRIKRRALEIARAETKMPRVKRLVRQAYFTAQTKHILARVQPTLQRCNRDAAFKKLSNELIWLTLIDKPKKPTP